MATKFSDYMASINARKLLARINVFKDVGSTDLYVDERDPLSSGGNVAITAPLGQKVEADSVSTVLSSRHEAVATPISMRISDSTEFTTAHETYALNTQFVKAAQTLRLPVSAAMIGWDFTNNTRKEIRTDTNGDLQTKVMNFPAATPSIERSLANAPLALDYSTANIAAGAAVFTTLIASTTAKATKIHVFDSNGRAWYLCFGAAASEVRQIIIPPGGDNFELLIPLGTRISANVVDTLVVNSGLLQMSLLS